MEEFNPKEKNISLDSISEELRNITVEIDGEIKKGREILADDESDLEYFTNQHNLDEEKGTRKTTEAIISELKNKIREMNEILDKLEKLKINALSGNFKAEYLKKEIDMFLTKIKRIQG